MTMMSEMSLALPTLLNCWIATDRLRSPRTDYTGRADKRFTPDRIHAVRFRGHGARLGGHSRTANRMDILTAVPELYGR